MRTLTNLMVTIGMTGLALLCFFALLSFNRYDACFLYDSTSCTAYTNILGFYGANISALLLYLFGFSAFWLIPSFLTIAWCHYAHTKARSYSKIIGFLLFMPVTSSLASLFCVEFFPGVFPGGVIGIYTSSLLLSAFGDEYRTIFLFVMVWALLITCVQLSFVGPLLRFSGKLPGIYHAVCAIYFIKQKLSYLFVLLLGRSLRKVHHSIKPISIADIQDDPFWEYYALIKKSKKQINN